jgi:hypothetical protein
MVKGARAAYIDEIDEYDEIDWLGHARTPFRLTVFAVRFR